MISQNAIVLLYAQPSFLKIALTKVTLKNVARVAWPPKKRTKANKQKREPQKINM
jgi:hypothetical protein